MIEDTAAKLGLTGRVGWEGKLYHEDEFRQFHHETAGSIWGDEKDKKVKKAVAQTAIGQKNVKLTPLEIANMMATIARGGEKKQVKIADQIEYKNGTLMTAFKDHKLPERKSISIPRKSCRNCSEKSSRLKRGQAGASEIFRTK